jgi:hypothetical protein
MMVLRPLLVFLSLVSVPDLAEELEFNVADLSKMRKVEIDFEKRSVTAQGGRLASDFEKLLGGGCLLSCHVFCAEM